MLAAFSGHLECVKELCYHGANHNLTDNSGSTVLHWAMDSGNCQLVAWLLDNGADIHATDVNGWTPLLRTCTAAMLLLLLQLWFSPTTVPYISCFDVLCWLGVVWRCICVELEVCSISVTNLGKLFTHTCSVTKQHNLLLAKRR